MAMREIQLHAVLFHLTAIETVWIVIELMFVTSENGISFGIMLTVGVVLYSCVCVI